jgi:hypothetical protein
LLGHVAEVPAAGAATGKLNARRPGPRRARS